MDTDGLAVKALALRETADGYRRMAGDLRRVAEPLSTVFEPTVRLHDERTWDSQAGRARRHQLDDARIELTNAEHRFDDVAATLEQLARELDRAADSIVNDIIRVAG